MPSTRTRAARVLDGRPRRREQEMLDAAARVFHLHGYTNATVQHVADELGILKGSLYYYIRTKEDLLFRLLEQVHDEVDELLARVAAETEGRPPLDRLGQYVRVQTLHSVRHLARLSVYYHDIDQLGPERRRSILDRRAPHEAFVRDLIVQAQAEGSVAAAHDPQLLSNCVFATIIWTYRWYRPNGPISSSAAADACARYAVTGISTDA
jgi:AcrR family transcriptional regulator